MRIQQLMASAQSILANLDMVVPIAGQSQQLMASVQSKQANLDKVVLEALQLLQLR